MNKKAILFSTWMIFISLIFSCVSAQKLHSGWSIGEAPKKKVKTPNGFSYVEGGTVRSLENTFGSYVFDSAQVGSFLLVKNHLDTDTISIWYSLGKKFTVAPYLLSKTEVTNKQYREFISWIIDSIGLSAMAEIDPSYYLDPLSKRLNWSRRKDVIKYFNSPCAFTDMFAIALADAPDDRVDPLKIGIDVRKLQYRFRSGTETVAAYPDTLVWLSDFTYSNNEPLAKRYFQHPAFNDYPVVGVSWHQAKAYCDWLSRNSTYEFRLPTYAESISAYEDKSLNKSESYQQKEIYFPWGHNELVDKKARHLANLGNVIDAYGFRYKSLNEDGLKNENPLHVSIYTSKVASFPQTVYGLYDIAGNVAEWTEDGFNDQYIFNMPNSWSSPNKVFKIRLSEDLTDISDRLQKFVGTDMDNGWEAASMPYFKTNLQYVDFYEKLGADLTYLSKLTNPKAVVGGSFLDSPFFLSKGVIKSYSADDKHSYVGFRVAADVIWK